MSPCELLNGRKLKTELPVLSGEKRVTFRSHVEVVQARDERIKRYIKELADERNHARRSGIQEGDRVLVSQPRVDKLTTPFDSKPYEVVKEQGSMVTANKEGHTITRNTSCFKKVPNACGSILELVELDLTG